MAIIQLGEAFKNFFAGRAGFPQFRKKGVHDRFTLTNDQFSLDGCRIRIPNLGWVRMRESLRFAGKIMSATISRVADRWFVSITVDTEDDSYLPKAENHISTLLRRVEMWWAWIWGSLRWQHSQRERESLALSRTRHC